MPARPPDPYPATVELPVQTRADVRLMPETVDAERRTVEVVWSTGAAVRRRDSWTGQRYDEVLSLKYRRDRSWRTGLVTTRRCGIRRGPALAASRSNDAVSLSFSVGPHSALSLGTMAAARRRLYRR
jgi:hypothetical protein